MLYNYRIILEASFSLYDKTFADNIGSILILAVIVSCYVLFDILIINETASRISYFLESWFNQYM
jgi:hypothetical protein